MLSKHFVVAPEGIEARFKAGSGHLRQIGVSQWRRPHIPAWISSHRSPVRFDTVPLILSCIYRARSTLSSTDVRMRHSGLK